MIAAESSVDAENKKKKPNQTKAEKTFSKYGSQCLRRTDLGTA
jgi:hypothetical protein